MRHKKSLLHIFHSLEMGGAQTRFMQILKHTDAKQYDHSVFAINGCYNLLDQWPDDAVRPDICKDMTYKKGAFVSNVMAFRKLLSSKQYDLVQTQNWATIEAVIANSPQIIPHIHNEDGFGSDEAQTLKTRRNIIRRLFCIGKKIIVPSRVLENIAERFWSTFWTDIIYVPNGIYDVDNPEEDMPSYCDKTVFVTVAMLRAEKNIEAMIDMVAYLKKNDYNVILKIVGSGPEQQRLEEYAQSLKLSKDDVLFLGFQSDYMPYIHEADIFLLSSLTEQQPYSILQAMSAMKAILSTDVGDVYQMVSVENKPYVSENAFQAPYGLVQKLINEKKLCRQIGISNKYWQKQHYNIEISLKKRYQQINYLVD